MAFGGVQLASFPDFRPLGSLHFFVSVFFIVGIMNVTSASSTFDGLYSGIDRDGADLLRVPTSSPGSWGDATRRPLASS